MSTLPQRLADASSRTAVWLRDYAELTKLRVTSLILMTAWCGYYFASRKAGSDALDWRLLHTLLGVALVSSGAAALNEVMERDVDRKMLRTARRPLPAGRMSLLHAIVVGGALTAGGSVYRMVFTNGLTGLLTFLTAVVYLAAYTPLKRFSPVLHLCRRFSRSHAWSSRLDRGSGPH